MEENNFLSTLTSDQLAWRRRILEISFPKKYSHLGSCLTVVDAIGAVYATKRAQDVFVLSAGHAAVAWYVILEEHGLLTAKEIDTLFIHPDRNPTHGIEVSAGSLGQGLPISVGMALADPTRVIYCAVSDGESAEGSIWEALRIASDHEIKNLQIMINANGWGAYDPAPSDKLQQRIKAFWPEVVSGDGHDWQWLSKNLAKGPGKSRLPLLFLHTRNEQIPAIAGQDAHYHVMNEVEYKAALAALEAA
jgi:transketolase